jgi:hypothetical protein
MIWKLLILISISYFIVTIPLIIAFNCKFSDILDDKITHTMSFFLFFDIFLSWNFGYFEKGKCITKRS